MNDLRFAVRGLRRSPGFTIVAVVTLALGIGATTVIFTAVRGVLLRPLPYPDAERLVRLYSAYPDRGIDMGTVSLPDFRDWSDRAGSVPRMGAYTTTPADLVLLSDGGAREIRTAYVSSGLLPTLGVDPMLGRTFREEDEIGEPRVVVVSHAFWRQELGADPDAVGRPLTLSDQRFELIGVMPPGFGFPVADVQAWALLAVIPPTSIPFHLRFVRTLSAVGRLAPDATLERAAAELSGVAEALALEHPEANAGLTAARVVRLHETVVGGVRSALWVLFGAVGFVLLIACVNVAHLLLARGEVRSREIALRRALGARRSRIVRTLLTESLVLAVLGGAAGALLALAAGRAMLVWSAGLVPRAGDITVDLVVLGFALVTCLTTVLVAGLYPALAAARPGVGGQLGTAVGGAGRTGSGHRSVLVAAEVAIALVLLIGAGLLVRSLWTLRQVDPGFHASGTLAMTMVIPATRYPEAAQYLGLHDRIVERILSVPGVESVGSIRHAPMRGSGDLISWEDPEHPPASPAERGRADLIQVTPDLFRALGVPVIRGRGVLESDRRDGPVVVVVNETFARTAFPGDEALDRAVRVGDITATVVGVVGDIHQRGLDSAPTPTIYVPIQQIPRRAMSFIIRTAGDPLLLSGPVREAVRELDPAQAIQELTTLESVIHESVGRSRFLTILLAGFASLALALASIGVYGVLAFAVRQRTREIGIRMALGADHHRTMRLVLRQGMVPVFLGVALGTAAAWGLTRVLSGLLFEIRPFDPPTYAVVIVTLGLVALGACWLPARRAIRIHPMEALRHD